MNMELEIRKNKEEIITKIEDIWNTKQEREERTEKREDRREKTEETRNNKEESRKKKWEIIKDT